MAFPKISIITPSFNQGKYLEETINSVLDQNYPNLEYIVIDGGSSDNSVEIIKKYSKYLSYWVSEKDNGQSHAINKGLDIASGEIINWLNSDDYYESATFHNVSDFFSDKETRVVCGRSRLFQDGSNFSEISNGTDIYLNSLAKTIGWARIDQPATFFRRECIQKIGNLNSDLHYIMDREWWIRYLFNFGMEGIRKTEEIFVNFRLHQSSKTVKDNVEFNKERDALFMSLISYCKLNKHWEVIKDLEEVSEVPLNGFESPLNPSLIEAVINYFFLLKAHESYAERKLFKTEGYLKFVNERLLGEEDLKLLKKIKFRNKLLKSINLIK